MSLRNDSSYFGLKDIYPEQSGSMALDEITITDLNENYSMDKNSKSTNNAQSKSKIGFVIVGMFVLTMFLGGGAK